MSCNFIIPARSGSKGIPGKNSKLLNGKPLIAYMIEAAQAAKCVERVYVSTDGSDIADVARAYGAQVINRPEDIAGDTSSSESAILHALDEIEGQGVLSEHTFFGQCTAPLTQAGDFDRAYEKATAGAYDCVFAAKPFHGFLWEEDETGRAVAVNHDPAQPRAMRQDLAPQYQETGAFYVLNTQAFRVYKSRFCGKAGFFKMSENRSIDIDTLDDWALAESLLAAS